MKTALSLSVVALLFSSISYAESINDRETRAKLYRCLTSDQFTNVYSSYNDGTVIIKGYVDDEKDEQALIFRISEIENVKDIQSLITVRRN